MAESIELDFRNAKRQAEILEQLAQRLKEISDNAYVSDMETLQRCWKGENGELMTRKMEDFRKTLSKTAGDLDRAGKAVYKIAKTNYDADKAAEAIVRVFTG